MTVRLDECRDPGDDEDSTDEYPRHRASLVPLILRLKRRRPGERIERLRFRFIEPETRDLRHELEAWAQSALPDLRDAVPELPESLSDRLCDAWEPLFAIADLAGREWPIRARKAALELGAGSERMSD